MRADIFTIQSLHNWLATQEDREYTYTDNNNCLLAQYFRAMGLNDVKCVGILHVQYQVDGEQHIKQFPPIFDYISIGKGWTIRQAQARAAMFI